MRKLLFFVLIWPVFSFAEVDFSNFDRFQESWTREEIEEKFSRFLDKDHAALCYLSLSDEELVLYDMPKGKEGKGVDYRLKLALEKKEREGKRKTRRDLIGAKIAIDPGHFGGEYARLEERYIDIPPSLEREKAIQFDEGTLSFLTAVYLKILLEKEGAIVLLTRDGVGLGAYSDTFFGWLKKNPDFWSKDVSLHRLFRKYYNPLDLRARAAKINAFAPELTVAIHYNSHAGHEDISSNSDVVSNNFNLAFIGGSFCVSELEESQSRYEFMRMLVSEDLIDSVALSRVIIKKFETHLGVPTISKKDGARYLDRVCLEIEPGIYARNLALTRLIHGPICYGETLVQNNIDECLNLDRKDFVVNGVRCSSRIKQVAEAYFEGIKEFLLNPAL